MTSITTYYLEMTSAEQLRPKTSADSRFQVMEATARQWPLNRFLYQFVGEKWAWKDKLVWTDAQWRAYVADEHLLTFVAYYDGSVAGYFELAARDQDVEIAYFGLVAPFIGRGLGGPLLTRTLQEAWKLSPKRVWVHTCTLDHEAALANYMARGMVVYKSETNPLSNPGTSP